MMPSSSRRRLLTASFLPFLAGVLACGKSSDGAKPGGNADAVKPYVLAAEPTNSIEVEAARATAKAGESVVVHGRVQEVVEGRAAFMLVDASMKACNEKAGAADSCTTPWDFCCDDPTELAKKLVSVEVRGNTNSPLTASLLGNFGFDHLKHVVVKGKVETDAKGNVTIVADGIYVRS